MNKDPFLKLQSSKTIEELLAYSEVNHRQNWLLSYLDVFVLIVMLIITLITLNDLRIEEEARNTSGHHTAELKPIPRQVKKKHPSLAVKPAIQPEPVLPPSDPEALPTSSTESLDTPQTADRAESNKKPAEQVSPDDQAETLAALPVQAEIKPEPAPAPSKREALENTLTDKLGQLGLSQTVEITITEDYAQLEIQDKILFKSSKASLTGSGEALLKDLAPLLKQASGLIFIEGHTDNRPIETLQFPSNWELGSARATSVLHYLTTQGLDGKRMRAVTYADTMPIADNSTAAGREKNRRVSILIKVQEQDITL